MGARPRLLIHAPVNLYERISVGAGIRTQSQQEEDAHTPLGFKNAVRSTVLLISPGPLLLHSSPHFFSSTLVLYWSGRSMIIVRVLHSCKALETATVKAHKAMHLPMQQGQRKKCLIATRLDSALLRHQLSWVAVATL
jgi:hypothetical protein